MHACASAPTLRAALDRPRLVDALERCGDSLGGEVEGRSRERGELSMRTGPVWDFDELPLAHQAMDENRANGKMVVRVGS